MRNISEKFVEKIKIYILCLLVKKCLCEIMWPQMTTWSMRMECWITKATNTLSEYVILIVFPLQQWLKERASVLRYT